MNPLDNVIRYASESPARVAVESGDRRISYPELACLVTAFADWLAAYRPRSLGLLADNDWPWLVADLAALQLALPLVPLPPFFTDAQQAHVLMDAGVDLLLLPATVPPRGKEIGRRFGLSLQRLDGAPRPLPGGVAKITYTSGTTGQPKGVCLAAVQLEQTVMALSQATASVTVARHLCTLPLAVLLENVAGAYLALSKGLTLVLRPLDQLGMGGTSPDPQRLLGAINQSRPDSMICLPQTLQLLVTAARCGELKASPAFVAVGGGKTPQSLLRDAQDLKLPVYEGYGLSECGSVVALNTPEQHRLGSVGRPLAHVRVSLAPDGEVLIGGNTMLGYLGQAPGDGPVASGDLGYFDGQGYLHIRGRKKHTIVTRMGRNVAPEWLEAESARIPELKQILVFGDEQRGICALAITEAPAIVREQLARLNRQLPDYARIERLQISRQPFTVERGELTANGRLRRADIMRLRALG